MTEPTKLNKTGRRSWETPDGTIEVYLTISSHAPAIRGCNSTKVRHYEAWLESPSTLIGQATSFYSIQCRIAEWQAAQVAPAVSNASPIATEEEFREAMEGAYADRYWGRELLNLTWETATTLTAGGSRTVFESVYGQLTSLVRTTHRIAREPYEAPRRPDLAVIQP